jgi:hypothetical protein
MQHCLGGVFKEQLMNIRQTAVSVATAVFLCLATCFPSWAAAASAGEASFKLAEQSLDNLRQKGLPDETLKKLEALKDQKFNTEDEFLEAVRQAIGNDQTVRYKEQILQHAADDIAEIERITEVLQAQKAAIEALQEQNRALMKRLAELEAAQKDRARKQAEADRLLIVEVEKKEHKQLEQRVEELETEEAAREEATRSIIRDALSTLGSKINESVAFGGTFEVTGGSAQVFEGRSERVLRFTTLDFDFDIQVNDWTLGTARIRYDDSIGKLFLTSEGFEDPVDRLNVDTANVRIGDPQRFPPFLVAGRMYAPFGISTGDPVADVLTLDDPLTIEVFETREDVILLGVGLPTPPLTPPKPPVTPPPVRPLVLNPLVSYLSRAIGYKPRPPRPLTPITPTPAPPLFNGGIYIYNGNTEKARIDNWKLSENFGATLGFRTKGNCGRPYDQLVGSAFCPWAIDIDVDYNSSVFDSLFLESEYRDFLRQIGFVPGMAAHVKANLGRVSLVAEWNGATSYANFTDGLGNPVRIKPSAWQITLGYQFDWNPWVEAIGLQGNYVAIGYSQSHDLAGVTRVIGGVRTRVGNVARRRFVVSVGEWVLGGVRIALEYTHNEDYGKSEGGTGRSADGIFSQLTYEW